MTKQPLIIGHRGASALAPENTIAAFTRASRDGADGIEFDVRLAHDQVPVVIHDARLKRTAAINKLVSECTSVELKKIDVGHWFHARFSSEQTAKDQECVPTLAEVFQLFTGQTGLLYLEMKGEPVGKTLPGQIVRLLKEHSFIDRVVVESFDLTAIAEVKRIDSAIRTAALFEPTIGDQLPFLTRRKIPSLAAEARADEVALHHRLAHETQIAEARQSGFDVVVWTVEKPEWVRVAKRLGIKALITNNPAALLKDRDGLAD